MKSKTYHFGVLEAVAAAGGVTKLAAEIGRSRQCIGKWIRKGCSPLNAILLEKTTGVSRTVILPEVFGKEAAWVDVHHGPRDRVGGRPIAGDSILVIPGATYEALVERLRADPRGAA